MSNKCPLLLWLVLLATASSALAEPPLKVICDPWSPYQTVINEQVGGFSTTVVETVFTRMQVRIDKIRAFPWKRALHMIEDGQADALFSANYTDERTRFVRYPDEPLVITPWVMWVREGSGLQFRSMDDLDGKTVGLVNGYSYTPELWDYVKKHKNGEIISNDELNFKKLHAGRVDYIVAELGNGNCIARNFGFNRLVPLLEHPVKLAGLYIVFNKATVPKTLVDRFSGELKKLKQESAYRQLHETYFGDRPIDPTRAGSEE